jgi:hypothetical protein
MIESITSNSKLRLKDVIISDAAFNYEEGKWEDVGGKATFHPDYDFSRTPTGDMQAFAQSKLVSLPDNVHVDVTSKDPPPCYRYGDFISGSTVRQDANDIFQQIRSNVSPTYRFA